jgi:hypothetical protein
MMVLLLLQCFVFCTASRRPGNALLDAQEPRKAQLRLAGSCRSRLCCHNALRHSRTASHVAATGLNLARKKREIVCMAWLFSVRQKLINLR